MRQINRPKRAKIPCKFIALYDSGGLSRDPIDWPRRICLVFVLCM
jgi:hypothetical protein